MISFRPEQAAKSSRLSRPEMPAKRYFFFLDLTVTCGPHHQNGQGAGAATGAHTQTTRPQAAVLMMAPPTITPATIAAVVPPSARAGVEATGASAVPATSAAARASFFILRPPCSESDIARKA
jgi:hypothetical protein